LRALGREEEATAHLARARELVPETDAYNRACLEALAGNPEAALDYLEKALAQTPGMRAWAAQDPDLVSLHDHPRFQALIAPVEEESP
jgi:tetratricopeptide (TPR) repeat protein